MNVLYLGPDDFLPLVERSLPRGFQTVIGSDSATIDRLLKFADVVLDASLSAPFPRERLARAKRLKLFIAAATGANHIDAVALQRRSIPLLTLQGQEILEQLTPAAEHSWLLLAACARHLRSAISSVLRGQWERAQFPGIMLRGKTLGIVGCGRIGQWMARYARAFEMVPIGYDPHISPWPTGIRKMGLDAVLSSSDFITIHVPLNDETRGLIGRRALSMVKPGAIVVNTSRGEVLDESALVAALQEGRVAAAGLDVLAGEPDISSHPLVEFARKDPRLIVTPHIAGFSPEALRLVLSHCCERIAHFFGSAPYG